MDINAPLGREVKLGHTTYVVKDDGTILLRLYRHRNGIEPFVYYQRMHGNTKAAKAVKKIINSENNA